MKKLLCSLCFLLCLSVLAQTPITFRMLDLTGSPLNRAVTFTPMNTPLAYGTNIIHGTAFSVTPVNGVISTNLYPGNWRLTVAGLPSAFTKFVPDTTNTVNLADAQYTTTGLVQMYVITNTPPAGLLWEENGTSGGRLLINP